MSELEIERLHSHAVAMCAGYIGESELAELSQILEASSEAKRYYVLFLEMHASLDGIAKELLADGDNAEEFAWELIANSLSQKPTAPLAIDLNTDVNSQATNSASSLRNISNQIRQWTPLFLALLIGILGTVLWYRYNEEKPPIASQPLPSVTIPDDTIQPEVFVAQLVSNTGAVWNATARRPLESGDQLGFDETVTIQEGIATFELSSGLNLKLEGPAVVSIDPDGMPDIQYGKVIASLPWGAKNTAIKTSLGEVQLDGDDVAGIGSFGSFLKVFVFRGEVSIETEDSEEEPLVLSSGEGKILIVGPSGERVFRRSLHSEKMFSSWNSVSADILSVSNAYVASVRKSLPIGYWRFEDIVKGKVLNEVSNKHHGTLGGKSRLVLQEANHVVEFGFGKDNGYLFMEESFDELAGSDYTFEVWIKPNHFHRSTILGLVNRRTDIQQTEGTAFLLETMDEQFTQPEIAHSLRFLHRSPPGARKNVGNSCYSSKYYEPRKWQHVVAVKEGHKMQLYVNGSVLASSEDRTDLVSGLNLVVGQLYSFEAVRPFVGQMDELAVYDHALTEKEIKSHYKYLRK